MKKYTLLFAFVTMFGNIFGQNVPKVLWEDTSTPFKYAYSTINTMRVSQLGNILVISTNFDKTQNAKVFDKNGKLLWVDTDYFNKPDARFYVEIDNPNYTLIKCQKGAVTDSLLFFDKNFKFIKGFSANNSDGSFYTKVDDGILYQYPQKPLIKYDINAKEEWTYKTDSLITIITDKAPYVGIINKSSILNDKKSLIILDKKGQKKGATEPESFNSTKIYPTNDNGFWATTPNSYLKFDSTGKKTATFNTVDLLLIDKTKESRQLIAPDNSLVFIYFNTNKKLCFTKIDSEGNVSNIVKKLEVESDENLSISNVKISKEGAVMYVISYSYLIISTGNTYFLLLGSEKFEDSNFGWYKKVIPLNNVLDENDTKNDAFNICNPINTQIDSLQLVRYGVDGKMIWTSDVIPCYTGRYVSLSSINNVIYISCTSSEYYSDKKSSTYQLDAKTGKTLWKIENEVLKYKNYRSGPVKNISMDNDGNTTMIYYTPPGGSSGGYLDKVRFIGKKGNTFGLFEYPGLSFYTASSSITQFGCWALGENNSFVSYTYNAGDNDRGSKFYFQKISPCNYNFSTPVGAVTGTEKISGLTEACPTEKIKISAAKYDGAVYEWQKDGKILPTLKASEHEMSESGTYKLTIKDTVCQYSGVSNELKINIRPLPSTTITAPKTTFCEGERNIITATTNGKFLQWQKDEKDIPNATTNSFDPSFSGNYRVGVRDEKCPQIGYSNVLNIIAKPLPDATISADAKGAIYASSVKLSANTGTGLSYQWFKDDVQIPKENGTTYDADKSGKYAVSVTKEGCSKTSEPLLISILVPLANEVELGEEQVQVYPNPSNGNFKIVLPKSLKGADIQLLDSFGRERSLIHTGEQAQADGLGQGLYFLKISKNGKVVTSKVVIEAP
jgi:Secretion system C-terminal sorting domain